MTIRVAINGYGRIGRNVLRALYEADTPYDIEIAAINATGAAEANAHLTKYDTVHGRFPYSVELQDNHLVVNGDRIPLFSTRDPAELPWDDQRIDVVFECTGAFRSKEAASIALRRGA